MDLQTEITEINDDVMNGLFEETPAGTPNADNLVGAKKTAPEKKEEPKTDDKGKFTSKESKTEKAVDNLFQNHIESFDLDEFDEKPEEEVEEEEIEEEKPKDDKKAKADTKDTKKKEEPKEEVQEDNEEETTDEDQPEVKGVLKSTVDYLIQSGIWQDFEGREDLDIDEDTYAKLVAQQDALRITDMFNELVDSTGPFGKAIIEHVRNGGNPDAIIDLFKEQKQVDAIPTDNVDGQKELIKHYYAEVLGWKPERVEKRIGGLVLSNELEDEAKEVKGYLDTYYKKEADRLNKEQEDYAKEQADKEKAFESNIRTTIKDRKDLTSTEKRTVEDYLLSYDQRLPNGNMVNKFYVNFAKMQADPKDYVDLVMFVMDKQKFMQKISTQEKTKAAADAFKFIKGNGAVSTKKGSSHDQGTRKKEKEQVSLNWGIPSR